jgi:type VI protein secretion system component Hcp
MTRNHKLAGNTFSRIFPGWAILLLIVSAPVFVTPSAWAAVDAYIRIPGMDGASKEAAHMNWIMVSSVVAQDLNGDAQADRESSAPSVSEVVVSKSASGAGSGKATIGSATSGAGSGKAAVAPRDAASGLPSGKRMHKPLAITKEIDKSSPLLSEACASGKHFQEVDVDLASGGKYKLTDVMISSYSRSSGGDRPTESISFTYQKIEMTR